jgi:hypothetical protein
MGAQTECDSAGDRSNIVNRNICFKSAVTEPSIMFLTSAKDVAVEYKYVWCNMRSCLMKTISDVEHVACFCVRRHIVSFVTLEVILAPKRICKEC